MLPSKSKVTSQCLNSVHSPAAVRNSPLSLEGGISILVSIVTT